jgi:hypothetical protein
VVFTHKKGELKMTIDTMPKVTLTDDEYGILNDAYDMIRDISNLYEDENTDKIRFVTPRGEHTFEAEVFQELENHFFVII